MAPVKVPHPDFLPEETMNDIAIVKLEYPVDENRVLPLCSESYEDTQLATCGMGTTFAHKLIFPSVLQEVKLQERPHDGCKFVSEWNATASICATATDFLRDSCLVDSGGPLYPLVDNEPVCLYGVLNYGLDFDCNWGGLYARVSAYAQWINETKASLNEPPDVKKSVMEDEEEKSMDSQLTVGGQ